MANAVWPTTLPSFVLEQGFQENLPDNNLESSVDAGQAKIRPRFTAQFQRFVLQVQMDQAQSAVFRVFFNSTLNTGSLPFDWVHPMTRQAATFRFRKPAPQASSQGGIYSVWTLNLELLSYN
jgi:antitoxin component of RelBE/YafQ-DinJ toxin-antitoxin module